MKYQQAKKKKVMAKNFHSSFIGIFHIKKLLNIIMQNSSEIEKKPLISY